MFKNSWTTVGTADIHTRHEESTRVRQPTQRPYNARERLALAVLIDVVAAAFTQVFVIRQTLHRADDAPRRYEREADQVQADGPIRVEW